MLSVRTCRAPELFEVPSNCEIDERSDMWSLGCTLYAMAYGEFIPDKRYTVQGHSAG